MTAVILVGHGSKRRGFQAPMEKVARALRRDKKFSQVLCAYLDINPPSIHEAIDQCALKKHKRVSVLPYFVLKGKHVKLHIPQEVAKAQKKYRGKMRIRLCPYLGYHKKLVEVVKERLS